MNFGITMFTADRAVLPSRLGVLVEEFGFESIFLPEHSHIPASRITPFPSGGDLPEDLYRVHDPLESLAAIAAVTSTIRLGTSTLVIPDHDPIMLAKRVSTIDHLSNGRVELGVGVGWNLEEMANHGIDPEQRWIVFRERVEAIREIWTHDLASYHGECVNFDPIYQWPKPIQKPHPPVLIGGTGPTILKRVLGFGTGWIASGRHIDGDALEAKVLDLRRLADEGGRGYFPVTLQQATPTPKFLERYVDMGIDRCTLRVEPGDEGFVSSQLEDLVKLVEPFRP